MSCKCKECIFSHDHPFIKTKEPIENPRHCALHFCTVDAEGGCKDGKARMSDDFCSYGQKGDENVETD